MVLPTLTPGATLLALHHGLNNLQGTMRARSAPDLSRALVITLGAPRCVLCHCLLLLSLPATSDVTVDLRKRS